MSRPGREFRRFTSLPDKTTFRTPLPSTGLEFTGERFTTLVEGEIRHEHLHRYFFAMQFCVGKTVLDIASGEGYGSALLATVAERVMGVDASDEAVKHAIESYTGHNLSFHRGVATDLPVPASTIDVVVSFETLEHLTGHQEFLRDIKRVLRPGGLLVLSTPDHEFFASSPPNPYHLKELVRAGFQSLIGEHFRNAAFFVQSSLMGSVIAPDQADQVTGQSYQGFRRVRGNIFESAPTLPCGMYMVGVASDADLPEVHTGSFDDREFQLGLYAELQRRDIERLRREADVERLRKENCAAAERETKLETELNRQREEILRREGEVGYLRQEQRGARAREVELEAALLQKRDELLRLQGEREALAREKVEREVELLRKHEENLRLKGEAETLAREMEAFRRREVEREEELLREREETLRLKDEKETLAREMEALRRREVEREEELVRKRAENLRLENERDAGRREIGVYRNREAQRETELQRTGERLSQVQSQLASLRTQNSALQAEVANLKRECSALQTRESEGQAEIRWLLDRQARVEEESAATAADLANKTEVLRRDLTDRYAELEDIKNSWSWRASAPLRWIGMPVVKVYSGAMRVIFGSPAFRYTGKPLARLLSNINIPGARWLLPQVPLFDARFYQERYPDAAKASKNLWAHYLAYGCDESREPHPLFQGDYYRLHNPDVAAAGINPLVHYFGHGAGEGRDPNPNFRTSYYLEHYPDVRESGINPLLHFALYGKTEGRQVSPPPISAVSVLPPAPVSQLKINSSPDVEASTAAATGPLISVVMPTFNTPSRYLRLAIESVLSQRYQRWQLCIYDDGSSEPETLKTLKAYEGRDQRMRIEFGGRNQGIASATNQAISLATGQYVAMLDHDDEIVPEALLEVAKVLNADPAIDVIYSDQAYIDADGGNPEPFHKPDWSPHMFRGVMFVGHLLVVRRSLAVDLGGFKSNFDRVQDFEFMLRVSEKTSRIYHLPKNLYYWRRIPGSVAFHGDEKGPIEPIQAAAVNAQLSRLGIPAVAEPHPALAHRLVIKPLPRTSTPSVLIAVRDAPSFDLSSPVESILEKTAYSNFKLLIARPPASTKFARDRRVEVGNRAKLKAQSPDYLVYLNSDLEVLTADWIDNLLLYCEQPQIACAAPLIVDEGGKVWHSGLVLEKNGNLGHPMRGWPAEGDGYAGSLSCAREVSCVSGECLMVSRQTLEAFGGLVCYYQDPLFEGADLALRAHTMGRKSIVTPRAVLRKHSGSKQSESYELDRALFPDRWSGLAKFGDPYYNPNFASPPPGYQPLKSAATAV